MSKPDSVKNESEIIIQELMNLLPKNEDLFSPRKNKLSCPKEICRRSYLSKNEIKTDVKFINTPSIDQETAPITSEPIKEEKIKSKKNETQKISTDRISIMEENEEDTFSTPYKKVKNTSKKEKKIEKFCGNKRRTAYKRKINCIVKPPDLSVSQSIIDIPKEISELNGYAPQPREKPKYEEKEKNALIEKELLLKLVEKEGFKKVFNCLTITPLDRKDPLEKDIDDIINSIGLLRTSLILSQIKFETIDANNQNTIINDKNEDEEIAEKENDTNNNKNINSISSRTRSSKNLGDIKIISERIGGLRKHSKRKKNFSFHRVNKRKIEENPIKMDEQPSKSTKNKIIAEELELGVHLQKDKDGKIYKYLKHHFRENKGNKMYIYYCADTRCKAKACYYIKSMKFELVKNHGLKYEEHCFIQKKDRSDHFRVIIEEFRKRNCNEAQVFKKDSGSSLVKWYD